MNFRDRFLWHYFKLNLANTQDRNALHLVVEVFWASVLGAVATFNAAFAIRLGADNFQTSLLSSIPALMAVLVSIPAGQFLQRKPRRKPWVFGALWLHRAGFVLVALSPFIKIPGINNGLLVVLVAIAISAPAHFFNVGWLPMMAEIIPENRRAAVVTARSITNQVTLSIMVFLAGQWLNSIIFPVNYQVIYLIGFAAAMVSQYHLMRLDVPDSPAEPEDSEQKIRSLPELVRSTRDALTEHQPFLRITVNTLLHGFGVWMAAPLYALYYVRTLDASDAWLGLNGTIASIGTIVGYSLWRGLLRRWGEPLSLKRTIVLVGIYPMLVGLTPSLPVILIFGALNGLVAPGVNLSHFNTLLRVTPPDARPRYTAIYMTIMNMGAAICPFISIAVANVVGLAPTLVAAGLISVIGSTSFWWWPVAAPEPEPVSVPESG